MRIRTEIFDARNLFRTRYIESRKFILETDRQVGIRLVVLELNIESRILRFDPREFELKGLDLGLDDGPIDSYGGMDHAISLSGEVRAKVRVETVFEILGLTYIDNAVILIVEAINPGLGGNIAGTIIRRVGHRQPRTSAKNLPV